MKILLLFCLLLNFTYALSSSGYKGRRFAVFYENPQHPVANLLMKRNLLHPKRFIENHQLTLEFAMTSRTSFGVFSDWMAPYNNWEVFYKEDSEIAPKSWNTTHTLGLYFKFFTTGYIAPNGPFILQSIGLSSYELTEAIEERDPVIKKQNPETTKAETWIYTFGGGYQSLLPYGFLWNSSFVFRIPLDFGQKYENALPLLTSIPRFQIGIGYAF